MQVTLDRGIESPEECLTITREDTLQDQGVRSVVRAEDDRPGRRDRRDELTLLAEHPQVVLGSIVVLELAPELVGDLGGEADLAVAAASILARAEFIRSLKELEHEFGQAFPPGAGTPVLKAGRDFVKSFGRDQLASVAKLHFKTIDSL